MTAEDRRAIVLVLDGLGIGAMPDVMDVRKQDVGTNTLAHVAHAVGGLQLPALARLGLGLEDPDAGLGAAEITGAHGSSLLGYSGADTYMGHQEIMGTIPGVPRLQRMVEVRDAIRDALEAAGHRVEEYLPPSPMLVVDGRVVVHDNMETDPGRNINVTASYDDIAVDEIVAIGEIVRSVVDVSRVIVVMGSGFPTETIADHIVPGPRDTVGVDSPGLGVYNDRYKVRHLGIGVDVRRQLPSIAIRAGLPVRLIGKAADVVECEGATGSADVRTADVLEKTLQALEECDRGVIVSNVQEGDLSGHAQDAPRWARVLQQVDSALPSIEAALRPGDLLLITGDHGNDPTIGHSQHTRERTPLLVTAPWVHPVDLGVRASLADIAATACEHLHLPPPQNGTSFYQDLQGD